MKPNFDQSDLPNIPGFRVAVDTRDKFHKSHVFDVCNGIPVTDIKRSEVAVTPQELENKIISKQSAATADTQSEKKQQSADERVLPRYVVFDRKVLRYYAYFMEDVFNSPIERSRVRKVVIYYYLEDDTVMIDEVRTENSGIPQATFLKRQRVPTPDNKGWLKFADIAEGEAVSIYNRSFQVVDADKATRDYVRQETAASVVLAAASSYPKDDYILAAEKRAEFMKLSASEAI